MNRTPAALYGRKAGERMDPSILEKYTDSVFGYAFRRTYSREEAEELSQEILLTALTKLPSLRDESRMDAWFWGVAENVSRAFARRMGKQRAMFSYDVPELSEDPIAEAQRTEEQNQLCARICQRIARMSAMYREILVLRYYDGLSVKTIAERLGIPEGTVTWRLSEGRRKLKKECETMNETALHPVKMKMDIYGTGNYGFGVPFPSEYIEDALSQNILWYAYEKPRSVEELADLCGVPAYYVEDCLQNLKKRCAVVTAPGGRVQTDFIIWTDKYARYHSEHLPQFAAPLADRICPAMADFWAEAGKIPFWRGEKSEAELLYLCSMLAFRHLEKRCCTLPEPEIPENYDGYCWRYIASRESVQHRRFGIGIQSSENRGSRGSYAHRVYHFAGFRWKPMMIDTYINVCEDVLTSGTTEYSEDAARAIERGDLVRREDGSLFVPVPAFTREQKARLDALAETHFAPLMEEYADAVCRFAEGYIRLFPKHLREDAQRMSRGSFGAFFSYLCDLGRQRGVLPAIPEGAVCEVLVQHP